MNICIDMRPALSGSTGVGNYVTNLVEALAQIDANTSYHLFSSSFKERYSPVFSQGNFRIHDRRWPVSVLNLLWNRFSWPPVELLLKTAVDVVHSPTPMLIPTRSAHCITTVHDIFFHTHPDKTIRETKRDYSRLIAEHCMKSDAIIAVSEHTKRQLVEILKIPASKIYPIHHGTDLYFMEPATHEESERIRKRLGIERPYLLFVGTREPRKNLRMLLEAFRAMNGVDLLLAGPPGWQEEEWRPLLSNHARVTGYLGKSELRALYQGALALVFPSVDEGFGLPLLEAMAAGTPILASDIPVFHEIANSAFLAFDPASVDSIREAMVKICEDNELRTSLVEKGKKRLHHFSWQETARKTLELYQHL